jgi:hypothetical protein
VDNPDLGHPGFEVTFSHVHASGPEHRSFVIDSGLRAGPGGSLQQTGFILLTTREAEGEPGELRLSVGDPCGRQALVTHEFEY